MSYQDKASEVPLLEESLLSSYLRKQMFLDASCLLC